MIIDLSHAIVDGMITYPGLPGPVIGEYMSREASRGHYEPPTEFQIGSIEMVANTGTYLDVPSHRYATGEDLEAFPLERLVDLPAVVLSPNRAGREIVIEAPERFEGKALLIRTGWSAHWGMSEYTAGPYPFLGERTAASLSDAGVLLVGIDSLNVDDNSQGSRPAHSILLAARIPIVEHLTNLDALPETEFRFHAAPLAVRGAGSFPVRAFAVTAD